MKELSVEEKAKAYDEALERAKKWRNAPNIDKMPTYGNRIIEDIFPELKESEDEKTRNELIGYFRAMIEGEPLANPPKLYAKKWIAWLEKQDKNKMGISEATKQKLEDNLNKALEKETPESCNEFLDKQGDKEQIQKTLLQDNNFRRMFEKPQGKSALEAINEEKVDNANKVEPKFKVGDTICYDSFGRLVSFTIANIVEDGTDNPMYEDKDGNSVFQNDIVFV